MSCQMLRIRNCLDRSNITLRVIRELSTIMAVWGGEMFGDGKKIDSPP